MQLIVDYLSFANSSIIAFLNNVMSAYDSFSFKDFLIKLICLFISSILSLITVLKQEFSDTYCSDKETESFYTE